MFGLNLDFTVLGDAGCYVHVACGDRIWSGKTRLEGYWPILVTDGDETHALVVETKGGRRMYVKPTAVTYLSITPLPHHLQRKP